MKITIKEYMLLIRFDLIEMMQKQRTARETLLLNRMLERSQAVLDKMEKKRRDVK